MILTPGTVDWHLDGVYGECEFNGSSLKCTKRSHWTKDLNFYVENKIRYLHGLKIEAELANDKEKVSQISLQIEIYKDIVGTM